jgi:hypothetical protein
MEKKVIYIDWNLFSILKNPVLKPHVILKDFLLKNIDKIQLVYSDAHLGDLAQNSDSHLDKRIQDLQFISDLTNNICIVKYFGVAKTILEERDPIEFFETIETDNSDYIFRIFENARKTFTDNYGTIRDELIKDHFKNDPKEICNFTVKQLDELVKMMNISPSLDEFLKFGLTFRTSSKDPLDYTDLYYSAYTSLDLLGYFPDSMSEKGRFENLKNDALHSGYGSICDAFITNDNKCFHKSKLLFNYYECPSKLIKTCKVNNLNFLEHDLNEIFTT